MKEETSQGFYHEIIEYIKKHKPNKQKLSKQKTRLSAEHKLKKTPTDIQILMHAPEKEIEFLKKYLYTKPGRTMSGVAVIAIMTKPMACPHGRCAQCPGGPESAFGEVPQSYTGKEPATMRGARNHYNAYLQVFNRLEQYIVLGQSPEKAELIIMGGTFPSTPKAYQERFVSQALKAMNDFSKMFYTRKGLNINKFRQFFELPGEVGSKKRTKAIHKKLLKLKARNKDSLQKAQEKNQESRIRCVGLTIETRPDYAKLKHCNQMLRLGCTRVELGVQSLYDRALKLIDRGHTVADSEQATRTLKDLGFKINYHMMPGLPGTSFIQDIEGLKRLFGEQEYRPDMLKIYPCMVLKGTRLYNSWKKGLYKPLTTSQAARMIIEFKKHIPEYVRIMRVQRDIPTSQTEAGVDMTNLRQNIHQRMKAHGLECRCIRCREIKSQEIKSRPGIKTIEYMASAGTEYFISMESHDRIIGFVRMRYPSQSLRKEITMQSALIRELHVYGSAEKIGGKGKVQHKGYGRQLLKKAEQTARKAGKNKMVIISGIGVRPYYKRLGYKKQGPYMVKYL